MACSPMTERLSRTQQPRTPVPKWLWKMLIIGTLLVPVMGVTILRDGELRAAVLKGQAGGVRFWLRAGANPNLAEEGFPLLTIAVMKEDFAVADALLMGGANVNALSVDGFYRPLSFAAARGNEAAVDYLLDQGAVVDGQNTQRATALHLAAMNGHARVVRRLLDAGADPAASTAQGATPLDLARQQGRDEVAVMLEEE